MPLTAVYSGMGTQRVLKKMAELNMAAAADPAAILWRSLKVSNTSWRSALSHLIVVKDIHYCNISS